MIGDIRYATLLACVACGGRVDAIVDAASTSDVNDVQDASPAPPQVVDAGAPPISCEGGAPIAPPYACSGVALPTNGGSCANAFDPCEDPTGSHKTAGQRCENGSQCQ
jgi:hypothetical protein